MGELLGQFKQTFSYLSNVLQALLVLKDELLGGGQNLGYLGDE
jgi:hypothetical protein